MSTIWNELTDQETPISIEAGQQIVVQGVRPDALWVLQRGSFQVELREGDLVSPLRSLGPGDVVGELSVLSGDPASASVLATTPGAAYRLPRSRIQAKIAADGAFGARFYRALGRVAADRVRLLSRTGLEGIELEPLRVLAQAAMERVPGCRFDAQTEEVLARYETVGDRPRYLWCWAAIGLEGLMLPSVATDLRPFVRDTKVLAAVLNCLIDDVADRKEFGAADLEWAIDAFRGQGGEAPEELRPVVSIIGDLRRMVDARLATLPGYERFARLYQFDWENYIVSMRWGSVARFEPAVVNAADLVGPGAFSMQMPLGCTIDWMAGGLDDEVLSPLREALLASGRCNALANALATWQREIPEGDRSSALIAEARSVGVLGEVDLREMSAEDLLARIESSGMERRLLSHWQTARSRIDKLACRMGSVDARAIGHGTDTILGMYLLAEGRV